MPLSVLEKLVDPLLTPFVETLLEPSDTHPYGRRFHRRLNRLGRALAVLGAVAVVFLAWLSLCHKLTKIEDAQTVLVNRVSGVEVELGQIRSALMHRGLEIPMPSSAMGEVRRTEHDEDSIPIMLRLAEEARERRVSR